MSRSSTFKEDDEGEWAATSSLAAQALLASKGGPTYDYTSMGSSNETGSFWGVLARKAKAILEDDNMHADHHQTRPDHNFYSPRLPNQTEFISKKLDSSPSPGRLTSPMTHSIGRTLEEGRTNYVESKGGEYVQAGSRKIQIVRKGMNEGHEEQMHKPKNPTSQDDQLKASRDVAMATAAKAKLLLRELKTVKADLAFTKQRCSQLEEENKILRDARHDKGGSTPHHDDDMIRNQLETLLAEKGRLAHENSVYARENRVLREIVEYHQMTTQDVIYFDEEGPDEEVTEDYPMFSASLSLPDSPTSSSPAPAPTSLFRSASAAAKMPAYTWN